jgi:ATP-dependent Lon protease
MSHDSDEYPKLREGFNVVLSFPVAVYKKIVKDNIIQYVKNALDEEFYGMEQVKEQILVYVNNRLNNPKMKDYSLGLIGEPGTGKTALALALSRILNFPFEQICCSSMANVDSFHGHNYTYVGSQPGEIVRALIRMECMNGILFLDEFDKIPLHTNLNGLLQLLDPVQNHNFKDQYIGDTPIDLSSIWFILSMNKLPDNQALRDRIFVVQVPGYTHQEKVDILKNHTVPRLLNDLDLNITISEQVLSSLVSKIHNVQGMRIKILMYHFA